MNEQVNPSGEGSEDKRSEDAGLTVDEKFARLAAEFDGSRVQGPGAKEEAARTRELRARWARNPPQPQPWRADGPKPAPDPDPTPPQDPWGTPRKKTARDRARGSVKALVALLLVSLIAYGFWPRHHSPAPLNATPAGTAEPWTTAASPAAAVPASASPSMTFTNPDDEYFVGSPALTWADNEAGFVIPATASLNGVSRSDITAGYQLLEKVMAAGNLDATVLDGGSISDFTNLLDPANGTAKDLTSWIAHPSNQDDPTDLVTRFNPATTRLLGHTVKVDGSMSAKAGAQRGNAVLTADYIFVYAVGPASSGAANPMRVSVHRTVQLEVVNPADFNSTDGKAWLLGYASSLSNIQCYRYDGYVDPGFTVNAAAPNKTGTIDPYATGNLLTASADPSPTSTEGECQATSRN
jgi:hypothetical protein